MTEVPLSRTEWATGRLQRAILSGELVPGERLSSSELAERWAISATPLREALQRLAADGFVEYTPQRGARVSGISERDVREVYELRLLLEPMALERSLGRTDGSWKEAVDKAYARLRAELEGGIGDMVFFERANRDFHGALLSRCDSAWLLRIVGMLADHSVRYRALSRLPRGGDEEVLREHEKLYEACVSGDVEGAVRLATSHLRLTLESVVDPRGVHGEREDETEE